jgi:hypothetical protein
MIIDSHRHAGKDNGLTGSWQLSLISAPNMHCHVH